MAKSSSSIYRERVFKTIRIVVIFKRVLQSISWRDNKPKKKTS